jgi:aminoglycoside phosphotransferase (APT) family kinase protein
VPPAEIEISELLVQHLLGSQQPALAHLPLKHFASGWDNTMFRLGDDYMIRLPRRALAAPLLLKEQQWLPHLKPHLPLPIPAPIFSGQPEADYPWHWSILPWLEGEAADLSPPRRDQCTALAQFFRTLYIYPHPTMRRITPSGASH